MARGHQRAERLDVARLERRHRSQHPVVLGHDVPGPPQPLIAQVRGRQLRDGHVAKCRHPQLVRRLLACPSAVAVAAGGVRVGHPGVHDDQAQPELLERERDAADLHRPAVQEDRRAVPAVHRGHLIHDADRRPDDVGLRPLAGQGQHRAVHVDAGQVAQGQADGALQCCAGGQARPARYGAVHDDVGARHGHSGLAQRPCHPEDVRRPAPDALPRQLGDGRGRTRPELGRPAAEHAVLAPRDRGRALLVDRDREHETVVVVGVLAHQVHPAGGRPDAVRYPPDELLEAAHGSSRRSRAAASSGRTSAT